MAGRVVAGDRQQHEERGDLGVRQALAVDLGLDERGHQVVAGLTFAVDRELRRELGQGPQRFAQDLHRRQLAEHLRVGGGDEHVRRGDDALAVGFGDADHVRDRHQRQPLCDQLDEVAAACGRRLLDDRAGVDADPGLDPRDLAGREGGRDEPAKLGVTGRVHREERLRGLEHLRRRVRELDAVARAEGLRVARDAADVLVQHHRPVGLAPLVGQVEDVLRGLVEGERLLAAQEGEVLVALLGRAPPEVERTEVDVGRVRGLRRGHAPTLAPALAAWPDGSGRAPGRLRAGRRRAKREPDRRVACQAGRAHERTHAPGGAVSRDGSRRG